jgi:hypothetical protein
MTQVLIVIYDLTNPGQNRGQLITMIKKYKAWARLGGSAYLVKTDDSPAEVRDKLKRVLIAGDKIYVGLAKAPAAWRGMSDDVSKWIHANQK